MTSFKTHSVSRRVNDNNEKIELNNNAFILSPIFASVDEIGKRKSFLCLFFKGGLIKSLIFLIYQPLILGNSKKHVHGFCQIPSFK